MNERTLFARCRDGIVHVDGIVNDRSNSRFVYIYRTTNVAKRRSVEKKTLTKNDGAPPFPAVRRRLNQPAVGSRVRQTYAIRRPNEPVVAAIAV